MENCIAQECPEWPCKRKTCGYSLFDSAKDAEGRKAIGMAAEQESQPLPIAAIVESIGAIALLVWVIFTGYQVYQIRKILDNGVDVRRASAPNIEWHVNWEDESE